MSHVQFYVSHVQFILCVTSVIHRSDVQFMSHMCDLFLTCAILCVTCAILCQMCSVTCVTCAILCATCVVLGVTSVIP